MAQKMPPLIGFLKFTYGKVFCAVNRISLVNESGADLKAGPYLYLINHVGAYDPIMVSSVMPKHIRWVAGAYLFKTRFMHWLLNDCCTAIPKQQGRSDVSTVKNMLKALRNGDNVGIFPEGTRTWDGEMMPIAYKPLSKMIRMFKMPVLFVHLEGGFAHQPRWSDFKRKGPTTVNVKHLLTAEQIAEMDLDTLMSTVEQYLHFSNDEWKLNVNYDYKCVKRAEGLQRLFYLCPTCRSLDSMSTKDNKIICRKCNTVTVLDDKDNLTSIDVPFTRMSQWHEWEAAELKNIKEFPVESGVLFQIGDANNEGTLETISESINVQLKDDVLYVDCNKTNTGITHYELPFEKMNSLILNAKQTMEIFVGDTLYRIRLLPEGCSLKYHEYYLNYSNTKENLG